MSTFPGHLSSKRFSPPVLCISWDHGTSHFDFPNYCSALTSWNKWFMPEYVIVLWDHCCMDWGWGVGLALPRKCWGHLMWQATSGSLTCPGKISRIYPSENKASFMQEEEKKEASVWAPLWKKQNICAQWTSPVPEWVWCMASSFSGFYVFPRVGRHLQTLWCQIPAPPSGWEGNLLLFLGPLKGCPGINSFPLIMPVGRRGGERGEGALVRECQLSVPHSTCQDFPQNSFYLASVGLTFWYVWKLHNRRELVWLTYYFNQITKGISYFF